MMQPKDPEMTLVEVRTESAAVIVILHQGFPLQMLVKRKDSCENKSLTSFKLRYEVAKDVLILLSPVLLHLFLNAFRCIARNMCNVDYLPSGREGLAACNIIGGTVDLRSGDGDFVCCSLRSLVTENYTDLADTCSSRPRHRCVNFFNICR